MSLGSTLTGSITRITLWEGKLENLLSKEQKNEFNSGEGWNKAGYKAGYKASIRKIIYLYLHRNPQYFNNSKEFWNFGILELKEAFPKLEKLKIGCLVNLVSYNEYEYQTSLRSI